MKYGNNDHHTLSGRGAFFENDSSLSGVSSCSEITGNTWSSSNRGLVRLGSFKITDTEDELAMTTDMSYRFSVIIHDRTDADSLAVASRGQIDRLHGTENPNVVPFEQEKFHETLTPQQSDASSIFSGKKEENYSSLSKPSRQIGNEGDYDLLCNSVESFISRDNEEEKVVETYVTYDRKHKQHVISSQPSVELKEEAAVDNRDALDAIFEGVETMTCGHRDEMSPPATLPKQIVTTGKAEKSLLKKTNTPGYYNFGALDNTDKAEQDSRETKPKGSVGKYRGQFTARQKAKAAAAKALNEKVDVLDSLCVGVEHTMCNGTEAVGLKETKDRDLFDIVFEPGCSPTGQEASEYEIDLHDNSVVASFVDSDSYKEEKVMPKPKKRYEGDLLDYIFESIESRTCRPEEDELSVEQHKVNKEFNPKGKKAKELWAKFRRFDGRNAADEY